MQSFGKQKLTLIMFRLKTRISTQVMLNTATCALIVQRSLKKFQNQKTKHEDVTKQSDLHDTSDRIKITNLIGKSSQSLTHGESEKKYNLYSLLRSMQTDTTLLANNTQHCWAQYVVSVCMEPQQCCHLLALVAYSLKPVKLLGPCKRAQHCWPKTPNNTQRCCNLLRPFAWALNTRFWYKRPSPSSFHASKLQI